MFKIICYDLSGLLTIFIILIVTSQRWGKPSCPISIFEMLGLKIAFIARHGLKHELSPTEVPYRANCAALKRIGVRAIIAFTACGSLQKVYRPCDFVIPTQVIDRTFLRANTLFESPSVIHVPLSDPFDQQLHDILAANWKHNERRLHARSSLKDPDNEDLTVICIEGPTFSTRAESRLHKSWGGAVVNMTTMPEARLAREAEMAYQSVCMVTDYDCWEPKSDISVKEIISYLKSNHELAEALLEASIPDLKTLLDSDYHKMHYEGIAQAGKQLDEPKKMANLSL